MNAFAMFAIIGVTCSTFLFQQGWLPRVAKFLPEALSVLVMVVVIVLGVRDRFRYVRPAYWFTFIAFGIVMICGALANGLEVGPMFAGLRGYLRAAPFFFLAAVYPFSEAQVRRQLLFLLVFSLVQFPLALDQRINELSWGNASGDKVVGMLRGSGLLSVFQICAACALTGFFIRKRIKLLWFMLLFIGILATTAINETKSSLILVPVGVGIVFLVGSQSTARVKNAVLAACMLGVFAAVFIPAYDHFMGYRSHGLTISEFFLSDKSVDRYMRKSASVGARSLAEVGRTDAILVPVLEMTRDPAHLAFGLGIGNASESALGTQFKGKYNEKFAPFLKTAASFFILEMGLLGLTLALLLSLLIYQDSRAVSQRDDGLVGALAAGWTGVTIVLALAIFYADVTSSETISYLFWYLSGLVASQRVRLARQRA